MTEVKLTELEALYVNFILPGDAMDVSISLCAGSTKHNLGEFNIPNGPYALSLDLNSIDEKKLENIDSIVLEFNNLSNEQAASYEFYVDGISGQRPYEGGK